MNFRIHIDISGLGNSGKGIISDYLMEFNDVYVPRKDFEFNLLRAPGGLMDMHYSLVTNWTPIRSDDSIRRFKKVVKRLGARTKLSTLKEMLNAAGYRYEDFFPGFYSRSNQFFEDIISFTYHGLWPYVDYNSNTFQLLSKRVRGKIKRKAIREEIYFSSADKLTEKICEYTYDILNLAIDKNYFLYATHNAFEPFETERYLSLFKNSKSIIVIRDPRDIYTNVIEGNKAKSGFYKRMDPSYYNLSAASSIDTFILYQKKMLSYLHKYENERVLIICFEDFICNYDQTSKIINTFLGLENEKHVRKQELFDPSKSIKNVGRYKNFHDQQNIIKIEHELSDLWNFR